MIAGVVDSDEGRICLTVLGPDGRREEVVAVIDTGYTASLSLRPATVAALGLKWQSLDRGVLADGSECELDVFEATVDWDGEHREILVDEIDAGPLVGMRLLSGFELRMQVRTSGTVQIERLLIEGAGALRHARTSVFANPLPGHSGQAGRRRSLGRRKAVSPRSDLPHVQDTIIASLGHQLP